MGDAPVLFPAHAPRPKLSKLAQGLIGLVPIALFAAWAYGGLAVHSHASRVIEQTEHVPPPDGRALFVTHCAYCHGEAGTGQGVANLNPRARYFGRDKYKFTSTHKGDQGGLPTDADLAETIRRGILGSAMPAFPPDKLTDAELAAVVDHVRTLSRAGLAQRFKLEADDNQEDPDWKDIAKKVEKELQPADPNAYPIFTPATPETIGRGQRLFVNAAKTACASCHGADGRGDGSGVSDKKNDPPHKGGDGRPNKPRDLTSGVFKSGGDKARLYALILYGIPGTPMPPHSKLSPREVEDLVDYVQSLGQQK
jgi:mono/diheme cytochrome c family protein